MKKKTTIQNNYFSLVLGGPLYRLYLSCRLASPPLELLKRRIAVIVLFMWLPLLLLSLLSRQGVSWIGDASSFLHDIETQVRFLVAIPLLIFAEWSVHQHLDKVVKSFRDGHMVSPEDLPRFEKAIDSTLKLCNSVVLEVALMIVVYTLGQWVWYHRIASATTSWYAIVDETGLRLTSAGFWFILVSNPIFQFLLLRWYLRLFFWFRLLWKVSRLRLRLTASHPDRAGGLAFLGLSTFAFGPLLFTHGAILSAMIANRVFYGGEALTAFKMDLVGLILFVLFMILGPLIVFTPQLMRAKRQGWYDYGLLANQYAQDFEDKWMVGAPPRGEKFIGSSDIQSLADMGNSYAFVDKMSIFPFNLKIVIGLVLVTILPLLPLVLTVVPVKQLLTWLVKVLF